MVPEVHCKENCQDVCGSTIAFIVQDSSIDTFQGEEIIYQVTNRENCINHIAVHT